MTPAKKITKPHDDEYSSYDSTSDSIARSSSAARQMAKTKSRSAPDRPHINLAPAAAPAIISAAITTATSKSLPRRIPLLLSAVMRANATASASTVATSVSSRPSLTPATKPPPISRPAIEMLMTAPMSKPGRR